MILDDLDLEEGEEVDEDFCTEKMWELDDMFNAWHSVQIMKHWNHLLRKSVKLLTEIASSSQERMSSRQSMVLINLKKKFRTSLQSIMMQIKSKQIVEADEFE